MSTTITHEHYDGTTTTGSHFRCVGSIRGWCGVKHRSIDAAGRCLREDQSGCQSRGGYSDRSVYIYDGDGHRQGPAEYDDLT